MLIKRAYLSFLIFPLIFFSFFLAEDARAGTADNVSGWVWSENIGWISFNCTNQGTCGQADYGVGINSDGTFSGYAWSENIGWIDFAPAGPYPASPNYPVCLDLQGAGEACDGVGNNTISGWARALAFDGGWDGWIKLRGTNYGVSIDEDSGALSGYAWSDMVIGWISFSGTNGISYGATTNFSLNQPPDKPGIPPEYAPDGVSQNHCSYKEKSIPTFHWTYSDPDSDPQTAYEIEVDDNSSFNDPKFNHLVNIAATSYALDLSQDDNSDWITELAWNTTYHWRVKVKDDQGNWSVWSKSYNFKTPEHAYPWADFTFAPAEPTQGEVVSFDSSASQAFGGEVISSYLWTVTQGAANYTDGTNNTSVNPHIIFTTLDNKIKLEVEDSDDYLCASSEAVITAQLPLPEYKEVPPVSWFKKALAVLTNFGGFAIIF